MFAAFECLCATLPYEPSKLSAIPALLMRPPKSNTVFVGFPMVMDYDGYDNKQVTEI